jgi:hypothetical protein
VNQPDDQKILNDVNKARGWASAHPVLTKFIAAVLLLAVGFILGKIF